MADSEPQAEIPEYQDALGAYHRAFAPELKARVDSLPIPAGGRVIDLACGDGTYARWLAQKVGPGGQVVAFDLLESYLEVAERTVEGEVPTDRLIFIQGDVQAMPFTSGVFDLVWCAQSLRSLPEPSKRVASMAALAKPGGVVAVLENDAMHQVLLPWPETLELALRKAELEALMDESRSASRFYIGRRLPRLFHEAGLRDVHVNTWAVDRQGPLSESERTFLGLYLEELRALVNDYLPERPRKELDRLADRSSADYLPDQADLCFTCIDHLVTGRRV